MPGQPLTAGDVHVVRVQLGRQSGRYLAADRSLAGGAVVIRSVQAGELVPTSAIGDRAAVTSRPVAVVVSAGSVDGLRPGSLVDVWVAAKGDRRRRRYAEPKVVVSAAEVVSVSSGGGVLSSATDATVRLLLADELVPQVLSAVDNGARIDLVAGAGLGAAGRFVTLPAALPVLTAVTGAWEAALVSGLEQVGGEVVVVRRCVDLPDLIATAGTGQARAVVVSADLRRLDGEALTHLAAAGVAVVGLVDPGDEAGRATTAAARA